MKSPILKTRESAMRRAHRTRTHLKAVSDRPRLTVFRSLTHVSAQIIDDAKGVTIVSTNDAKIEAKGKKPVEVAAMVGAELAKLAKAAGVTTVAFDRGSYAYHGRVKALAEAAREGGLQF